MTWGNAAGAAEEIKEGTDGGGAAFPVRVEQHHFPAEVQVSDAHGLQEAGPEFPADGQGGNEARTDALHDRFLFSFDSACFQSAAERYAEGLQRLLRC